MLLETGSHVFLNSCLKVDSAPLRFIWDSMRQKPDTLVRSTSSNTDGQADALLLAFTQVVGKW